MSQKSRVESNSDLCFQPPVLLWGPHHDHFSSHPHPVAVPERIKAAGCWFSREGNLVNKQGRLWSQRPGMSSTWAGEAEDDDERWGGSQGHMIFKEVKQTSSPFDPGPQGPGWTPKCPNPSPWISQARTLLSLYISRKRPQHILIRLI